MLDDDGEAGQVRPEEAGAQISCLTNIVCMVGSPAAGRKGGVGFACGNADAIILSVICNVGMVEVDGRVGCCSLGSDVGSRGGGQTSSGSLGGLSC